MKTSSQRLRSLILLSALTLTMPSLVSAQSGARPVQKTVTNNALTEDLTLGTRKLTITTESTVEMEEGATVEGADIWRESLGAQAQSSVLDDISALSVTPFGLSLLEAMDAPALKTLAGLANVTNDAQLKVSDLDDDTTMAADSATRVPSQRAVKEALSLRASLDANTFTGVQSFPNGSAGAPSLNFGSATTGIYNAFAGGSNTIDLAINGFRYFYFAEASGGVGVFNLALSSRLTWPSVNSHLGIRTGAPATLQFGVAGGVGYTLAGDLATASSDARGGSLTLEGGRGTGTGAGGDVIIASQARGSASASSYNTAALQQAARWSTKTKDLTEGTATDVVLLAMPNIGVMAGGAVVHWTVSAVQSSAVQVISGTSVLNWATGALPSITTTYNTSVQNTGTLTCTASVRLVSSGSIALQLNATSSLTQTFLGAQCSVVAAHNLSSGSLTITPQ